MILTKLISNNFNIFDRYSYFDYLDLDDDYDRYDRGPALEVYGTDLTALAEEGKISECVGREKELLEMMEILVRRQKNNPVLVGEAGVGKTAVVELFALRISQNLVPFVLEGRKIINLDLTRIVAGSRYRGEFELRFQRILDEVLEEPHTIVFIDEIHNIGGTGSAEGSLDAANILKPVLSRSGFQCIGATTLKEYEKIEKDPALNRRFQPVKVHQPSTDDALFILFGIRPSLESYHNVQIEDEAIHAAVELSTRYITDRHLPDKAIDLLDRAAAKEVIRMTTVMEESIVTSYVLALLKKVTRLRFEAFRRNDIPTAYIFQEVENAYTNFLLTWVDHPDLIPVEKNSLEETDEDENSEEDPAEKRIKEYKKLKALNKFEDQHLSRHFFRNMRTVILKNVEDLFLSSRDFKQEHKIIRKSRGLSPKKIKEILTTFSLSFGVEKKPLKLSLYRICLFLLNEAFTVNLFDDNFPYKAQAKHYFAKAFTSLKMHLYIKQQLKREKTEYNIKRSSISGFIKLGLIDFLDEDVESHEDIYPVFSELEQKRIDVIKEYLTELKPLLRRGLVESLNENSDLNLSEKERRGIYNLLGYFSTETGHQFLSTLDEPELMQAARRKSNMLSIDTKAKIPQEKIKILLSEITGIPISSLSSEESARLLNLENLLHKRVIGQNDAISAIAKSIRRSRLGIQNPNRPIASFLFCGPTGVGKTEVTKALAVTLFGSEKDMIRFDMSEFMEKFTVSRLIGAPPGYVGYEEGGQLTDAVRRKPYSVVLFDEVEKAHPDILNILLQILEDGRLTDSQKRLVPFENTVIILTSNAAAEEIQNILKINSSNFELPPEQLKELLNSDISKPEQVSEKKTYYEKYVGILNFLDSPIKESFLSDLQEKLQNYLTLSLTNYKNTATSTLINTKDNFKEDSEKKLIKEKALQTLKSTITSKLTSIFLPEFLNRLDDIIIFQPLRPEELRKICDIMVKDLIKRVAPKRIDLRVDEAVKQKLTREGYNPFFGARPLRRTIIKYIEDLISETVLRNPLSNYTQRWLITIILDESGEIVAQTNNHIERLSSFVPSLL